MKNYSTALVVSVLVLLFACGAAAQEDRVLSYFVMNQPVNDIAYSTRRAVLYASVPSTGGIYGNYIIAIDPVTKQITGSVFAGSEPTKLAISSDEEFLYVGLDGAGSIRRIVLDTMAPDLTFSLGFSQFDGPMYVEDLAVMPGAPNVIAVSRKNLCCSPRHEGVAIYNNGVKLPNATPGHTGSNEIEAGDDPNTLYGYNNETTEFGFRRMLIDANGASTINTVTNTFGAFGLEIKYSGGIVYASNGRFVDAATGLPAGTFALGGTANGLTIDVRNRRVFFVMGNSIRAFDSYNFQPAGSVTVPDSSNAKAKLIRWGRRGLAYRVADGRLALAEVAFVTRKLER